MLLAQAAPPCQICGHPASFARFTEIAGHRVGRFAHIRAVEPGGPRHDPAYPVDQIDSPENVFWCCTDCHDIVDLTEGWTLARLLQALEESRRQSRAAVTLTVDGEIAVFGEHAETVTGVDAAGQTTILQPGTRINVHGRHVKNVTGVKT